MNGLDELKFHGKKKPSKMNYVVINKGRQMRREVIHSDLARGRESATITAFGRDSKGSEGSRKALEWGGGG